MISRPVTETTVATVVNPVMVTVLLDVPLTTVDTGMTISLFERVLVYALPTAIDGVPMLLLVEGVLEIVLLTVTGVVMTTALVDEVLVRGTMTVADVVVAMVLVEKALVERVLADVLDGPGKVVN